VGSLFPQPASKIRTAIAVAMIRTMYPMQYKIFPLTVLQILRSHIETLQGYRVQWAQPIHERTMPEYDANLVDDPAGTREKMKSWR
jgi:hypothetical protein